MLRSSAAGMNEMKQLTSITQTPAWTGGKPAGDPLTGNPSTGNPSTDDPSADGKPADDSCMKEDRSDDALPEGDEEDPHDRNRREARSEYNKATCVFFDDFYEEYVYPMRLEQRLSLGARSGSSSSPKKADPRSSARQFVDDPINSTISSDAPALVTSTTNSTIASDEGVLRRPKADRTAPGLVASTSNSTIASDEGEAHWTAVRSYSTSLPTKPQ
jgi:hypothetical protein